MKAATATQQARSPKERALVIVESPTKAATIRKYLGDGFEVEASVGHVRDLVTRRGELDEGDARRDAGWVKYGVNVDNGFAPLEEVYRVPPQKKRQIDELKRALRGVDTLYLATDDDREGESISWHLLEELKPKVEVRRLVFHEITKRAIQAALENPRPLDMDLVNAQRTRRIIDRLYGWDVSEVLWRKIKPGLSAGRVQSVALRLLVSRERERIAFRSSAYWDLLAQLSVGSESFQAILWRVGDQRVVSGRDFDATTGIRKGDEGLLLDGAKAAALAEAMRGAALRVAELEVKPLTRKPAPPFTTSTLQQEANRRLKMSAQQTMRVAQGLYEKGLISYMRTDSTRMADEAVAATQAAVRERFGERRLAEATRVYETRSAGAQEAHEAIRPAGERFLTPEELGRDLSDPERKLYELIWRRTLACQMADAQLEQTTVDVALTPTRGPTATLRANGRIVRFDGFLAAFGEADDESDAGRLPAMEKGQALQWHGDDPLQAREHQTRPPARLNDASLVRALEEKGIGRPSTYAAILQGLLDRGYAFRRGNALVPTFMGMIVTDLLERNMPQLVDYAFTAQMEAQLDAIARGEEDCARYLRSFYRDGFDAGSGHVLGLTHLLSQVRDRIDPAVASGLTIGEHGGDKVEVRIGRFGTFARCGERTATVPEEQAPDELTVARAIELFEAKERGDAPLGHAEDGTPVFLRNGRYGFYLQLGLKRGDDDKPKIVSLSKGMAPETLDIARALQQLTLPRALGKHPRTEQAIEAHVGRYGDYLKVGAESRSLPLGTFAVDVTLEQAAAHWDKPRAPGGREMLREIGVRASDGAMISLWQGRYGLYVTDGKAHCNLKDEDPDNLDAETAAKWIAKAAEERAGKLVGTHPATGLEMRVMKGPFGLYLTDGAVNASLPRGMDGDDVELVWAVQRMADYGKPVKGKKGARAAKPANKTAASTRASADPAVKTAAKAAGKSTGKTAAKSTGKARSAAAPNEAAATTKANATAGAKAAASVRKTSSKGLASSSVEAPVMAPPPAPPPPSRTGIRRPAPRGAPA